MIRNKQARLATVILLMAGMISCREDYVPPVIAADPDYLVVEGVIRVGADTSSFTLSRTQPPGGNTKADRVSNASLSILDASGAVVSSSVNIGNGLYSLPTATLSAGGQYQVRINTPAGEEYLSDLVEAKQTPVIDSVIWEFDPALVELNFLVNTHDAAASTQYYRWEYTETWEYNSNYNSLLIYDQGTGEVLERKPEDQVYTCYSTHPSSEIIIGTSAALAQDVISRQQLYSFGRGDRKVNVKYSVIVRQYALTQQAYAYWQSLQRMTEQGGSIFDAQPFELVGNYHNVSNPSQPVIGYLSANSVTEKRIFIAGNAIPQLVEPFPRSCTDSLARDTYLVNTTLYGGGAFVPVVPGDETGTIFASSIDCVDCRAFSGTTTKPSFW